MEHISHMNDSDNNDWVIVCSQSLGHYVHCICGHRVKRITYLYHKPSKAIQYVGKTCVRKYGIEISLTNPILLDVIKANLDKAEWDRDDCVREHIQSQYTNFMTLALTDDISVNKVVGPFRRLLSDVCDLVSEYGFDLVDILRDIEREVESLNQTTRHQMVDEYSLCDSISEIASEHTDVTDEEVVESVGSEPVVEDTEDEPVFDIVDEPVYDIIEEPVVENPIIEDEHVYDIVDEPVVEDTEDEPVVEEEPIVENPIIEDEPVIEEEPVVENPIIEDEPVIEDEVVLTVNEDVSVFDIVKSTEDESVMVENPVVENLVVENLVVENLVVDNAVGDVIEGVLKSLEDSVTKKETAMERFLRTTSNINIGDTELCSATTHCYCAMKYRMRRLHDGIQELNTTIEKNRRETQELLEQSREQRQRTTEYLERSRKLHPELFPENNEEKN
jgi:hypothetical protein